MSPAITKSSVQISVNIKGFIFFKFKRGDGYFHPNMDHLTVKDQLKTMP